MRAIQTMQEKKVRGYHFLQRSCRQSGTVKYSSREMGHTNTHHTRSQRPQSLGQADRDSSEKNNKTLTN